ncbi:glycoside hydrolase family 88 protein [Paenibacillus qinlingensis]|uniref:Rhamnogalacturonyl hydrolase YesR n=1 Tax=Paenibacillus qinlingensis TaxID=1837343 RepID=A0ABU1P6N2_9BACL|nr:glycoside hydrolase family 88 protein [Paenibacillus qinlingensis]MDR6555353.1 rhamnogalacturonyl hydrolase YesR [Paenibacillus qinlingensis]
MEKSRLKNKDSYWLADSYSADESVVPADKRVPFGWPAASVSGIEERKIILLWKNRASHDSAWLRITVALDLREEVKLEVRSAVSHILLGNFDIRYASVLQPFQLLLSKEQVQLAVSEGISLRQTEGNVPLWIFVPDRGMPTSAGEAPLLFPHLYDAQDHVVDVDRWEAMKITLATLSSLQAFGWLEGCVLHGLMELNRVTGEPLYREALSRHFHMFMDEEEKLRYENPRSMPVDDQIYGIEGTLPFAMLAQLDATHPTLERAIHFWMDPRNEDGVLLDHTMLTAEGNYTLAYPMAVLAKQRGRLDLARLALRQLEARQKLTLGDDLYLRYHQDGSYSFRNWSRAYAWYLLGLARTLKELDGADFLMNDEMHAIQALKQELRRVSRISMSYQLPSGLWSVFLDDPDTGPETSGSAGIAAALAIGVEMGLLDKDALAAATLAKEALTPYLTQDGILSGVSQGNKGGESLQRGGYRVLSQMGTGLAAQLWAVIEDSPGK